MKLRCKMAMEVFPFVVLIVFSCSVFVNCVTVCDDFKCYINPSRDHCYDNPDAERNLTEIVQCWSSATVEEHYVNTADGYKIFILRVYSTKEKDPIVLGHGAGVTPFGWINRGNKSLAHFLMHEGHDVWIISFRGGPGSREHKTLSVNDDAYWQFSFFEVGYYDLDSTLELVMKKTSKKAIYIGHSLGSTAGYVYGIRRSSSASKTLKGMISLGPLAYMDGMKSYLRFLLPVAEYLRPVIYQRFHGELPLDWEIANCSSFLEMYMFEIARMPLYGDDFAEIDPNYLPFVKSQNEPSSIGIDILVHLSQIMRSKKFQGYDYGTMTNMEKYGSKTPTPYFLSDIPVPVSLFVGSNDWIANKENSRRIYDELNPDVQCGFKMINCDKWNHIDFIEAKDVVELLYVSLYKSVLEMCQGICPRQI